MPFGVVPLLTAATADGMVFSMVVPDGGVLLGDGVADRSLCGCSAVGRREAAAGMDSAAEASVRIGVLPVGISRDAPSVVDITSAWPF